MTRKILSIALVIVFLWMVLSPVNVSAKPGVAELQAVPAILQDEEKVVIYFFWGDGCPHCAKAKPVLEGLAAQHPSIELYEFEIYNSVENQELFTAFGKAYGFEPRYIPTILIGDRYWEGYAEESTQAITSEVERGLVEGSIDKGAELIEGKGYTPLVITPTETPETTTTETLETTSTVTPTETPAGEESGKTRLPIFGEVDLSNMGLFLSTALISFVDGFNPCSLWVLSMLLTIILHTGSRKKVLVIGLVFLTVTAAIYALFIAGIFTVLKVVSFVGWIQVVVALVALFFGLVNIKDYFFYKEGVSFTIADDKKPGIFQKMRKVMDAGDSWWGLIGGTIVLAAGVSLVEFSCTAGFPVLWTNLLTAQHVTTVTFILLLLLYMFIYQIDELGIFLVAVFTLKSNKLEEKHGRILKLIGGVLMLTLAVVMLVNPALMSDIGKSLIVFGIAFGVTGVVLLVHRVVLPKLGIHIGTEYDDKSRSRKKMHHKK
jgi:thiol-disulfide isomerase/thioredoxin